MGPTIVALVKLYLSDQKVRAAQSRLDDASRNLRLHERRVTEAAEKHKLASANHMQQQSTTAQLELDLKTRDAHIERLRVQQQTAKNNKEYQAFLLEINTEKADKVKIEDQTLKAMEVVETLAAEQKATGAVLEAETEKLTKLKSEISDRLTKLQAEVDALKPARDAAAAEVPAAALAAYNRLADRFEGEGLSAISKPDRRREEYACTACNIDLVTDVYNKLHSRDELVFCPSCHRILYIPDDMPPEKAINTKPKRPEKKPEETPAN
jgi:predicted  nucleic acid-binding Zn-ribbon protein